MNDEPLHRAVTPTHPWLSGDAEIQRAVLIDVLIQQRLPDAGMMKQPGQQTGPAPVTDICDCHDAIANSTGRDKTSDQRAGNDRLQATPIETMGAVVANLPTRILPAVPGNQHRGLNI